MKYVETSPVREEEANEGNTPDDGQWTIDDGESVVHRLSSIVHRPRWAAPRRTSVPAAAWKAVRAVWAARRLWLSFVAVGCALYGQKLLADNPADRQSVLVASMRWYAVGVALAIVAWWGSYRNKSCLLQPGAPSHAGNLPVVRAKAVRAAQAVWRARFISVGRYSLAFAALGLNLYCAGLLRRDYNSAVGGLGWLTSLLLLVLAFLGHRPRRGVYADAGAADVEDRTDWRLPRKVEILVFLGLFLLGVGLRFYRLGDWTTGVHPDEGYAGTDGMGIVSGHPVSPFLVGWYAQSNFYFWGIAAGLKLFGQDLFGLRFFSAAVGSLMIPPFYGLVRMWFGVRMALIATFLLAVSDLALIVSKQEFSNSTTPVLLVIGFYFLFRGLRTRRTLDFVLAGYANVLSIYFYNGGRLAPFMLAALLLYLFVLMPMVKLPGAYRSWRARAPGVGWLQSVATPFVRAVGTQARGVFHYAGQIVALVIACICFASPFMVYYVDHVADMTSRSSGVMIFGMADKMAGAYNAGHGPLYLGLRLPKSEDIYPVLPVASEQTPLSVKLTDDGFWPRVLWGQTTTTLSILTYRHDASYVYTVTGDAIVKPLEAALIVLGIAWALWRWRDTRMATLSLWFWSTIFVGGVLTDGQPYMPRLVGIVPTLAVFAAIPLNKLAAEIIGTLQRWKVGTFLRQRLKVSTFQRSNALVALPIVALLAYLGYLNYDAYFVRHRAYWSDWTYTGQAFFVREMSVRIMAEGRPKPHYYDIADGVTWWGDGANRFLNYGTLGDEVFNVSNDLPVLDNDDRDLVFIFWGDNVRYLPIVQAYYPGGEKQDYNWQFRPTDQASYLLTYYRVKNEKVPPLRMSKATYTLANGAPFYRDEGGLGSTLAPPDGLAYPSWATWDAGLVAPAFARYNFQLSGGLNAQQNRAVLAIDGVRVIPSDASNTEGSVILGKGVHHVFLTGLLKSQGDTVDLRWSAGGSPYNRVARKYLWNGPGRGLVGEVLPLANDIHDLPLPDASGSGDDQVRHRRVDGAIGFRHAGEAMSGGWAMMVRWQGNLNISFPGVYNFKVASEGETLLLIDDHVVVDASAGSDDPSAIGTVQLAKGAHSFELRYNWNGGLQVLDLYWQPPGEPLALMKPGALTTEGGAWQPGTVSEPGTLNVDLDAP